MKIHHSTEQGTQDRRSGTIENKAAKWRRWSVPFTAFAAQQGISNDNSPGRAPRREISSGTSRAFEQANKDTKLNIFPSKKALRGAWQ